MIDDRYVLLLEGKGEKRIEMLVVIADLVRFSEAGLVRAGLLRAVQWSGLVERFGIQSGTYFLDGIMMFWKGQGWTGGLFPPFLSWICSR